MGLTTKAMFLAFSLVLSENRHAHFEMKSRTGEVLESLTFPLEDASKIPQKYTKIVRLQELKLLTHHFP